MFWQSLSTRISVETTIVFCEITILGHTKVKLQFILWSYSDQYEPNGKQIYLPRTNFICLFITRVLLQALFVTNSLKFYSKARKDLLVLFAFHDLFFLFLCSKTNLSIIIFRLTIKRRGGGVFAGKFYQIIKTLINTT